MAKLLLNSLWGRLAMNSNKPLYKLITNSAEWLALISDDQNVVQSADFTHKNNLQVFYTKAENLFEATSIINTILACFVTSHARIKMHREFTKIGPYRIAYTDTDCVIIISKPGEYKPFLSPYLGFYR